MCEFFSCIVMKDKSVVWEAGLNQHHEILEKYKIADKTSDQAKMAFARVEILPPEGDVFEKDMDKWKFRVDERITPEWFSPAHKDAAFLSLKECLISCLVEIDTDTITDKKGLFLRNATIGRLVNSTVQEMWGSSTVQEMWGSSTVQEMWGSSTVQEMWESSTVQKMYDRSTVQKMYESSTVQEMWESSTVQKMYDRSTVQKMLESSTVQKMLESSTVCVYSNDVTFKIASKMAVAICRILGELVINTMVDK